MLDGVSKGLSLRPILRKKSSIHFGPGSGEQISSPLRRERRESHLLDWLETSQRLYALLAPPTKLPDSSVAPAPPPNSAFRLINWELDL